MVDQTASSELLGEQNTPAAAVEEHEFKTEVIDNTIALDSDTQVEQEAAEPKTENVEVAEESDPKWLKERLKRQERSLERKYQGVIKQLADTYQATYRETVSQLTGKAKQEYQEQQQTAPTMESQVEQAVLKVLGKVQNERVVNEERQKDYTFNNQVNVVRDKYEDYEDVVQQVDPYFTQQMLLALRELPNGAVESFYKAWKEDPEEVKQISTLSPIRQVSEMGKLYYKYSPSNKSQSSENHDKIKSNAARPLTPVVPTGRSSTAPLDVNFAKMAEDMLAKFKRK